MNGSTTNTTLMIFDADSSRSMSMLQITIYELSNVFQKELSDKVK